MNILQSILLIIQLVYSSTLFTTFFHFTQENKSILKDELIFKLSGGGGRGGVSLSQKK